MTRLEVALHTAHFGPVRAELIPEQEDIRQLLDSALGAVLEEFGLSGNVPRTCVLLLIAKEANAMAIFDLQHRELVMGGLEGLCGAGLVIAVALIEGRRGR